MPLKTVPIAFLPRIPEASHPQVLLLDTDVLIDSTYSRKIFDELFKRLEDSGFALMTISAVAVEFLVGNSRNVTDLNKSREYLNSIVGGLLQSPPGDLENDLLLAYSGPGQSQISYADYMIAKTLKKFAKSTCVLTANHRDFPLTLFDFVQAIRVQAQERRSKVYGIYSFSMQKYEDSLRRALKNK